MNNSPFAELERLENLTGTATQWRRLLGEHFDLFRNAFLKKLPAPARTWYCAKCHVEHEIIQQSPEEIAALAEELAGVTGKTPAADSATTAPIIAASRGEIECPDIVLSAGEIEQWTLHWPALGRALCQALGLRPKLTDLKLVNTWQAGAWSTDAVPVLVTIQAGRRDFRNVVLELTGRLGKFILLAPTNRHLDAACQELLRRVDAGFFALDGHVRFTHNGTLQAVRTPGELFARFAPQPAELDAGVARSAFALVQRLDSDARIKPPSPLRVFRLYCIELMTMDEIAARCRCSKGTVSNRLEQIRRQTGMEPEALRRISAHLEEAAKEARESGAAHLQPRALIYDDER